MYWQSGDLVSVMDHDGGIYYAQIRGFLEDQYCEKSAVINWLIPTTASPKDSFDPATYILGIFTVTRTRNALTLIEYYIV